MLDFGLPLRYLLLGATWVMACLSGVAWAVFRHMAIAEVGIILLTLACTLSILNDNARTRSVVRSGVRERAENSGPFSIAP